MRKKISTKEMFSEENISELAVSSNQREGILRKKPWTEDEDYLVRKLVEKYGPQRWSFIAKFVPGRLGKQCR